MGRKHNVQYRKHLLTYSLLDIGDSLLEETQKTLQDGDIRYTDFHLSRPGESEQYQFERLLYTSQWLIIFFTANYFNCPDSQFQLKMAFERACKQKLKNIIVLLPDYLLGLLPFELQSMPSVLINKMGWNKRFSDSFKQKPMLQQESEACDNPNHVHLSDYTSLTDTPLSEPERTREDLEDEGYFLPKMINKHVFSRIRWLKTFVRQEEPERKELCKDIRRAVKSNWFWRIYNRRITPHEEPCVCYIKCVCFTEILILTLLFGVSFYRMTDTTFLPYYEASIVLYTVLIVILLNVALFWSCTSVLLKIKRFTLAYGLYLLVCFHVMYFFEFFIDSPELPTLENTKGDFYNADSILLLERGHVRFKLTQTLVHLFVNVCSLSGIIYLPCLTSKYSLMNLLRMVILLSILSIASVRALFFISLTISRNISFRIGSVIQIVVLVFSVLTLVCELGFFYFLLKSINACFMNETHHPCLSRCLSEWSWRSAACAVILLVSTAIVFYKAFFVLLKCI